MFQLRLIILFLLVSGCSNLTNRATDEKLDTLRNEGLSEKRLERANNRFTRITERTKTAEFISQFETDAGLEITSLRAAMDSALERNIDIGRAAQDINAADVDHLNEIFGYLPQVRFVGNISNIEQNIIRSDNAVFQTGNTSFSASDYTLEIEQPLIDLSRIYAIKAANSLRSRAQVNYISTVQQVMYETFDAYASAALVKAQRENIARRSALLRRQIATEQDRVDAEIGDRASVSVLRQNLSNLQLDAAATEIEEAEILSVLETLTGASVTAVSTINIPQQIRGTERRLSEEAAIDNALENNPEVLGSIIDVTEANLRRSEATAVDFSPVLTAFARAVNEDRDNSRFGGGSVTEDVITGIRLTVPIFNANGNGYQRLSAEIDYRQSLQEYYRQSRQTTAEIRSVYRRLESFTKAIAQAQSAARSARSLVNVEKNRVDAGTSQDFIVTELESRAIAAQIAVQQYQIDYFRAWGELQFLSGLNLSDEL